MNIKKEDVLSLINREILIHSDNMHYYSEKLINANWIGVYSVEQYDHVKHYKEMKNTELVKISLLKDLKREIEKL